MVFLRGGLDEREISLVVKGHRATKAVNTKMLDEGASQWVAVVEQQSFKIARILKRTPIGHRAGGIDQRILANSCCDVLSCPPSTDGVVVVPGESQWVDLGMAGRTVRVVAVRL